MACSSSTTNCGLVQRFRSLDFKGRRVVFESRSKQIKDIAETISASFWRNDLGEERGDVALKRRFFVEQDRTFASEYRVYMQAVSVYKFHWFDEE